MTNLIPDGYELLSGRGRDNAREAIRIAEERGFPSESVLSQTDGYLIPLTEEQRAEQAAASAEFDVDTAKVPALDEHITNNGLDVDLSLNKADKVAAIKALESKGE